MGSFSSIPVEIVLYILKGASYKEIVSIAQTSSRFYALVKTDPFLWVNVVGLENLPFPTGYNLATIPFEMLYPLALRACSIARALQQPLILPKRHSLLAPCNTEMLEMRPARIIPGGRWTMFSADQHRTLGLHDTTKAEFFRTNQSSSYHIAFPRGDVQAIGGGIVRHVQRLSRERTENEGPFNAALGTHVPYIIDIFFPITSGEGQAPVFKRPVPVYGLDPMDYTAIKGSVIFAFRAYHYYSANDSLSLLDSDLEIGIKFALHGQTQDLHAISRAEFHPHLPKIILYVNTLNDFEVEPNLQQFTIWVFDIPNFAVLSSMTPHTNIGSIVWVKMAIEITHQYVIPDHWNEDIEELGQVPETYTSIHEFTLPSPRFFHDKVVIALCLTAEDSLVPISLGLVHRGACFTASREEVLYCGEPVEAHQGFMRLAFPNASRSALLHGTFCLPSDVPLKQELYVFKIDQIYGQVVVLRSRSGNLGTMPGFIIQY
ncbi:hypothetical protein SISSUDRAFT_1052435 [Sistotremastrum suecicum HHB10207 ss-3]|uniref:F-box domain-containing protein n=1 Tax=Sistotremastrum suecicum HHB10207 ss-3 TaxID=1314776 RepID=A0A165ZVW4_9AGAM|nr:hypothetical protein SISSUDRAFT_1052435 [Sistotremastrum suecicum HHB10207 ss-3]